MTGISPYLSCNSKTVDLCANKAAYARPGVVVNTATNGPVNIGGLFGNAGRGSFHGPGFSNFDASLHKNFAMPYNEKHQLAIRFEAFNALNHPNWGTPNINFSSNSFGQGGHASVTTRCKYQF